MLKMVETRSSSNTSYFYKQHFYKQRKSKIDKKKKKKKKNKQKLSNTPRLNFYYLKIIRFLHPCYQPKIMGDILKYVKRIRTTV